MMQQPDAYEFTARENETIGKAAKWAMALAGASLVMVAVHLAVAFVGTDITDSALSLIAFDVGAGVTSAGCYLVAAVLFGLIAGALRRVVATEGNDLQNMMKALTTLHRIFVLRIALVFLTVIAVVAVIAVGEGLGG